MRRFRKLFIAIASIAIPWSLFYWWAVVPHTPDLTIAEAEELISREFGDSRPVMISSVTRGRDGLQNYHYWSQFLFIPKKSSIAIGAKANFGYSDQHWVLLSYWYGQPPNDHFFWASRNKK